MMRRNFKTGDFIAYLYANGKRTLRMQKGKAGRLAWGGRKEGSSNRKEGGEGEGGRGGHEAEM